MGDNYRKRPGWSKSNKIKCCKDCKPPKRYPGCSDHCEDYKKEKAENELFKEKMRAERPRVMGKHDFDMLLPKSEGRKRKT